MNKRELFEMTIMNDVPDDVLNLSSSAGDNAAETVGWGRRYGPDGKHTDEFIAFWYAGVIGLLCEPDAPAEAREWFASMGVRF